MRTTIDPIRLLVASVTFLAAGSPAAQSEVVKARPGREAPIEVSGPPGTAPSFAQPLHGTLTFDGQLLIYVPAPSFWEVGVDWVAYTPFGMGSTPEHVVVLAQDAPTVWHANDFEDAMVVPPESELIGATGERTTDAAVEGTFGLALTTSTGEVYMRIDPGGPGGQNQGSGGTSDVDPPWPPGGSNLVGDGGWRLMGFGSLEVSAVELRMRPGTAGYEVMMRHTDDPGPGSPGHAWIPVGIGARRYQVRLWHDADPQALLGPAPGWYQLRIDGTVAIERAVAPTALWPDPVVKIGLIEALENERAVDLDNVAAWEPPWSAGRLLLRGEPFEDGVPSDLAVSSPGAIAMAPSQVSSGKALIAVPGPLGAWARDALPSGRTGAGVRCALRTADLSLDAGASATLIELGDADGGGTVLAALRLTRDGAGDALTLEARDDAGSVSTAAPVALDSTGAVVELVWWAAGTVAATGQVALVVDGFERARISGLDNDLQRVESAAVGVVTASGAVGGSLMVDDLIVVESP